MATGIDDNDYPINIFNLYFPQKSSYYNLEGKLIQRYHPQAQVYFSRFEGSANPGKSAASSSKVATYQNPKGTKIQINDAEDASVTRKISR